MQTAKFYFLTFLFFFSHNSSQIWIVHLDTKKSPEKFRGSMGCGSNLPLGLTGQQKKEDEGEHLIKHSTEK